MTSPFWFCAPILVFGGAIFSFWWSSFQKAPEVARRASSPSKKRHFLFAKPFLLGLLRQKKRRQAGERLRYFVRPNLVFGRAFFKKLAGSGAGPTETAFLFCKAFFFVPFASKKKASSGEAHGNPQNSFLVSGNPYPRGQCRRLFILNRTRSPEGSDRKTYGRGDPSPTVV